MNTEVARKDCPPLSKFHMSGLGKWMMLRLMKDAKSPALEEMIDLAKGMGVKFMACTTLR